MGTYSANPPPAKPRSPKTSSPGRKRFTSVPAASTRPAKPWPRILAFGALSPIERRANFGSPRIVCQSAALTADAKTRTGTWVVGGRGFDDVLQLQFV